VSYEAEVGELDARRGVSPAVYHPGGSIDVTITRRFALTSGLLLYGLLAVAGCSGSSSPTQAPVIDGRSFGENRDKMEQDALKAARKGRSSSPGRR